MCALVGDAKLLLKENEEAGSRYAEFLSVLGIEGREGEWGRVRRAMAVIRLRDCNNGREGVEEVHYTHVCPWIMECKCFLLHSIHF